MPRWKALSAELDPRARQLVTELRRLKDRAGLSTRQLSAKTGYSTTSWERYLGGTSLPPAEAVEALARVVGADPVRLLALREVAADTWTGRRARPPSETEPEAAWGPGTPEPAGPGAGAEAEAEGDGDGPFLAGPVLTGPVASAEDAEGPRTPGRSLRVALVAGTVALVLAVSSAVLLVLRLGHDGGDDVTHGTDRRGRPAAVSAGPTGSPGSGTATATSTPPLTYTCRVTRVGGLWVAGVGRTRDAPVAFGDIGPDVAEAQCLLRRAGVSPGGIDGMFGPLTLRAVRTFQERSGLVVDGMIGPHTWKALHG
ncbi:peptidoglycan-binding protein [Streptomyces sp. NPDC086091]|uniref:peptidoglycan-binding protein n=1 Tax=Streptomyces sp. NPDC086091 TaxID=3365751 RepID=UPI0038257B99